jgi:ankyrin repeat protein
MLIQYCKDGDLKKVKYYVSNRNVNNIDDSKTTPLMHASALGYIEIVKVLVENNANLNLQNIHGYTALIRACINNHPEIIIYLIEKGANINLCDKEGDNALILASKLGNDEIIKILINKKADIHHVNKKNQNCLWKATYYYNMSISFFFILLGVNPEIKDNCYKKNSFDVIGKNRDELNININNLGKPSISKNMKDNIRKLMYESYLEYLEIKRQNDNWERRRFFMMVLRGANIIPLKTDIKLNIVLDKNCKLSSVPRNLNYLIRQVFAYNSRIINKSSKNGCDLLELIISFI